MDPSTDLSQIKRDLATLKTHLTQYETWFREDGFVDSAEQQKLNEMQGMIQRAEERIKELESDGVVGEEDTNVSMNPLPQQRESLRGQYEDVTDLQVNKIVDVFHKGEGDETDVHWNDVGQGNLGNCYFLAGIAAVAKTNPAALKRLIKGPDSNGNYEVTLYVDVQKGTMAPKAKTVTITPEFLVDSNGKPLYAQGGDAEMWVMLLEKAYALLRGEKMEGNSLVDNNPEGYQKLDAGWGSEAMEVLTGHQAVMVWLKDHGPDAIKGCINATLQANKPLTTGSIEGPGRGEKATPLQVAAQQQQIVFGHEYVILDFDGSNLTLFNPWNRSTEEDDRRGQFTLPFGDYLKYFRTITSEAAPQ